LRNTPETASQSEQEEGAFFNVEEAVRFAREQFGDNLEVLDSAIEAATGCPFRNPGRVYQALQAVSEVALSWKSSLDSKSSMRCDLVQAFRIKGFDFKKDISQTCRTKFWDDYKFSFQGIGVSLDRSSRRGLETPTLAFQCICCSTKT
jgi:hypothetical protein